MSIRQIFSLAQRMTAKANRMKDREALLADTNDDSSQNISEDADPSFDCDDSKSETESDDASTDEYISQESDSDGSVSSAEDEEVRSMDQPETVEKGGVTWSLRTTNRQGRLPAHRVLKKKPGSYTAVRTIKEAFKLFITDQMLDEIFVQTDNYAKRHLDQVSEVQLTTSTYHRNSVYFK